MVSSNARSLRRSVEVPTNKIQSCILLDAALERCGNAPPSEIDASAVAAPATCCDFELNQLAQACGTCSKLDTTPADCSAASSAADIAIGMSKCGALSHGPVLPSSFVADLQPAHDNQQQHAFGARDSDANYTGPSVAFFASFFAVLAVIALGILFLMWRRCRQVQPDRRRAQRRAVLDLAESPVNEKQEISPWVRFPETAVSPPPLARSRTPSPVEEDMYEVPLTGMPGSRSGQTLPHLITSSKQPRHALVLASPVTQPVPIRRY